MEEGIVERYLAQLSQEENAGHIITKFYLEVYKLPSSQFGLFVASITRLVHLYGRFVVFYSVLDTLDIPEVDHDNVTKLLHYFCKKRVMKTEPNTSPLSGFVDRTQSKIDKMQGKKLNLRSPIDE